MEVVPEGERGLEWEQPCETNESDILGIELTALRLLFADLTNSRRTGAMLYRTESCLQVNLLLFRATLHSDKI